MVGVVDGLKMDELFTSRQPLPAACTSAAVTAAENHLVSIATTMTSAMTGLTRKAATNHADVDQEETIDFKDMPADLHAGYALKKHPVDLIRSSNLALYSNVLTTDKHDAIQQWRTVEYPKK